MSNPNKSADKNHSNAGNILTDDTAEKKCESCGKDFLCQALSEKCWCFAFEINRVSLSNIRQKYSDCLCPQCLENESSLKTL